MCRAPLRFSHLSFIPPVPYPPLRGTFPSRGRLTIQGKLLSRDLRASPCFVLLSGEKRRMRDNECQNSCDLVIDLGEAATTTLNPEP